MYGDKFRGKSFGAILDMNRGAGLGFDLLRLGLAVTILLSHTSGITGHGGVTTSLLNMIFHINPHTAAALASTSGIHSASVPGEAGVKPLTGLGRPFTLSHVPMFFALSGFLVAGSAFRTRNLARFLGLRALRIIPALFVEVFLSAVIMGAVFTTLPITEYFRSSGFRLYFTNIIGWVHFFLPGVWEAGPAGPVVNANLWTLPFEFECYLVMSALMILGLVFRPKLLTALFAVATVALLVANSFYGFQVVPAHLGGRVMVYYFVAGMLCYLWRYKIIFHEAIFLVCAAVSYCLMMYTTTLYVYPLLLTYVTMYIGLFPFPQFKLLKSGDYSYGIYLYGYPVTRGLIEAFPSLRGNLGLAAVLAVLLSCLFAAFSWHAIEKHCLKLKRFISPSSANITESLHPDEHPDGALDFSAEAKPAAA
jgi:peptidoglycan/LPS O-acetylase OafA/YrhL